jgi:hypothetical protein
MSTTYPNVQSDRSSSVKSERVARSTGLRDDSVPESLAEMIHAELRTSRYSEVRRIECLIERECIVLAGDVSSYFLKQIAQSQLFLKFGYSLPIVNDIRVNQDSGKPFPRKTR